jgi:exopolysaccharide production protein ExoQ
MPPQLALLLCIGFVLFLLWIERRGSRDASFWVWIPTLWLMLIASRPLGVWFGNVEGNEAGSVLDRWTLSALAVAAIVVLIHRRFDWQASVRQHKWLVALLAYMFFSTFWSAITLIALRRWTRELIFFIMALVVMSEVDPRQALESIVRRTAYVLLPFSLVLIKYYPMWGVQFGKWSGTLMWVGVTNQKNSLGRLCMISAFFLLFALYRGWQDRPSVRGSSPKWADIAVTFLALYLLKGSDSATSVVCFMVGTFIFLGLRLLSNLKLKVSLTGLLILTIFLIAFGTSTPFLGGTNVASYTASVGRDSTLTGRTEVWAAVLPSMQQQPLLGYGLGSFWTDARRAFYDIPTAHNGYLDVLLELGAVGLALYTFWLLSCTRQLHRALAQDYDWASLGICFLLMSLFYNITESVLNSFTEHMTVTLALASLVVSQKPIPASIPTTRRTAPESESSVGKAVGRRAYETRFKFGRTTNGTKSPMQLTTTKEPGPVASVSPKWRSPGYRSRA